MRHATASERALVLAPRGRDAAIAAGMLAEAGIAADACGTLPALIGELNRGAGFVVVTEEALAASDLAPLDHWLMGQEEWSDLPFVLLTQRGGGLERNPAARRYLDVLGNVAFLERPFHPTTLVSLGRSALRGRRRQYEARARLAALRDNEERLRLATESAEVGFWDVDLVQDQMIWPARVKAMFGISPDVPVTMRDFYEGLHRDDAAMTAQAFAAAADPVRRALYDVEYRTIGKDDGRVRWVAAKGRGVFDKAGRCVRVIGTAIDITSRKVTEIALRDLNDTLEQRVRERTAERNRVWAMSRDLLAIMGFDGYLKAVNPAWEATLGFDEATLLSRPFPEQVHPDDHEAVHGALVRLLRGEAVTGVEDRLRHADGSWRWIAWSLVPEGDVFYAVGRDVTAEKAAAAELERAQEALRQAQKMEAVGQLTGGVAHDFNNLLTIIKSSTDLLRRPGLSDERRSAYVDAISDTVDRASKLTGQLLAFARRQALKPEVFDAAHRIRSITDMVRTVVGSRVEVRTEIAPGACFVKADASQFETALVNLVVNARDAMNGEGRLTICLAATETVPPIRRHAGATGSFVSVSVADTGIGIPQDRLAQIFEPFFTTKEVGKGTGLGLSQVYGFAKQSGGDIDVQSEAGVGTTFTLYLPRTKQAEAVDDAPDRKGSSAIADGRGRRVLVVEDNVEVGRFSTQLLQDLGFDTTWATNADEALALLEEMNGFDAVFSDVVMPGMSGVDLGQEIRRRYPGLPVVLTSGYSNVLAEEGRHGFELLHKPYAAEDLSRVLRHATGEPASRS